MPGNVKFVNVLILRLRDLTCSQFDNVSLGSLLLADSDENAMKKAPGGDADTALAVVRRGQIFLHRRRPPSRGRADAGRPKFNQLEMVTTFTYRPSLIRIDARNFELSW